MSSASLGIVSGLAGAYSSQRTVEGDKAHRETTNQARAVAAAESAASAAGIGQTEEDAKASDRDADGRRPWELPGTDQQPIAEGALASDAAVSKDPTGDRGGLLDLVG